MSVKTNFEEIAQQLVTSAATEKARQFTEYVIEKVHLQGDKFLEAFAQDLKITFVPGDMFPVSDNRNYYLGAWQLVLAKSSPAG